MPQKAPEKRTIRHGSTGRSTSAAPNADGVPDPLAHKREKLALRKKKQREKLKEKAESGYGEAKAQLEELKKRAIENTRKWRQQKIQKTVHATHPFKTPQAEGKGLWAVRRALPKDYDRSRYILYKLAKEYGLQCKNPKENLEKQGQRNELVRQFYLQTDISHTMPGMKDKKTIKMRGKRERVQCHYLLMSTKEAYALFQEAYPEVAISKSSFQKLKPCQVLVKRKTPQNVCVCPYHANAAFACEAVQKIVNGFPDKPKNVMDKLVCSMMDCNCMSSKCTECSMEGCTEMELLQKVCGVEEQNYTELLEKEVKYEQWDQIGSEQGVGGSVTQKVMKVVPLKTVVSEFLKKFDSLKLHHYTAVTQQSFFQQSLAAARSGDGPAVLQIDFAENYRCLEQDAHQQAYFSYNQVTLFTAVFWLMDQGDVSGSSHSVVCITDNTDHGTAQVQHFLKTILSKVQQAAVGDQSRKVLIFSDGAPTQFKNRFMLYELCKMQDNFAGMELEWHFFASSHGKGAVDGVGGTVKRAVREEVLAGKANVQNAAQFIQALPLMKTAAINISSEVLKEGQRALKAEWEQNLRKALNIDIKKAHTVKLVRSMTQPFTVQLRDHSAEGEWRQVCLLTKFAQDALAEAENDEDEGGWRFGELEEDNEDDYQTDDNDSEIGEDDSKSDSEFYDDDTGDTGSSQNIQEDEILDASENPGPSGTSTSVKSVKETVIIDINEMSDGEWNEDDEEPLSKVVQKKQKAVTENAKPAKPTVIVKEGWYVWEYRRNGFCVVHLGYVSELDENAFCKGASYMRVTNKPSCMDFKIWGFFENRIDRKKLCAHLETAVSPDDTYVSVTIGQSEKEKVKNCC